MEQSSLNNMSKLSLNKDVFKQKGGTLGLVIIAGVFVLIAFNLPAILEWVNNLARLIVTLLAIAGLAYVILDPKVRLIVSTAYMLVIKKILGAFIKMDPISILEATISKMHRTIAKLEESMSKLNGTRLKLADKVDEKKEALDNCIKRVKAAIKLGKTNDAEIEGRQAKRLENLIKDYINLHESSEKWYTTLSKIAEMAALTVKDAENEVEAQKERYAIVKESHSAFKSAMSVINGDPDELAMFNQAWQYTQEDMMAKLGEMDRVINTAGGLMDKIDVEKEVYKVTGDELLKKYDELGIDGLFEKFEPKTAFPVAGMAPGDGAFKNAKAKYFN
jgi:phage shock protein A